MTNYRFIVKALALLAAGCGLAAASSISYGPYTIPLQTVNNGFTSVVNIQQFDGSLGTLNGVELDVIGNFDLDLSIADITGPANGNYSLAFGTGSINITGPGSLNMALGASSADESGSVPKGFANRVIWSGLTASASQTTQPSDLSDYIGTSLTTTALTFHANPFSANGTGDPGLFYSASGTAGGSISVIYTYTANGGQQPPGVPEPSTWAMMGGALLLLCVGHRPIREAISRRAN